MGRRPRRRGHGRLTSRRLAEGYIVYVVVVSNTSTHRNINHSLSLSLSQHYRNDLIHTRIILPILEAQSSVVHISSSLYRLAESNKSVAINLEAWVVSVRLGNGSGRRLDGPVSREVHDELGGEIIEIAKESRRNLGVLVGIDIETINDQEL